jgi:hypothetical protein
MDLQKNPEHLAEVIPIITNPHAIAVSQAWAGHPGMLLSSVDSTATKPDAAGYVRQIGALLVTSPDVHVANMTKAQAEAWCTASAACVAFTFACNGTAHTDMQNTLTCTAAEEAQVRECFFKSGMAQNGDPKWVTYIKAAAVPATPAAQQIWGKPLPGGAWAVIAINGNVNKSMTVSLLLAKLNLTGPVTASDIWKGGQPVAGGPVVETFEPPPVGPRDSGFFKLSPTASGTRSV